MREVRTLRFFFFFSFEVTQSSYELKVENLTGARYIGRKDTQIKLRGQRIELGEVESHVKRCFSGSRNLAAELVTPKDGRHPFLAAFIEQKHNAAATPEHLFVTPSLSFVSAVAEAESRLADAVPSYMIPKFLPIAQMPLGATGKADRRRLRESAAALSQKEIEIFTTSLPQKKRMPISETETELQLIWARVLNLDVTSIGMDDSFFRLGGDSITAMQVSAHARASKFSITVPDIFHLKTIAELLANANTIQPSSMNHDEEVDIPFNLSPIQQFFFNSATREYNHFNQSFLVRIARKIEATALINALEIVVSQHSMLRARFSRSMGGQWSQAVTAEIKGSYRFLEHAVSSLEHATALMNISQKALNIERGPILAIDMITVNGFEQYLFLVVHHLVIDLVSWRIILGDLEELLKTGSLSLKPSLPFQTWSNLQAEHAQSHLEPEQAFPFDIPATPDDYWGLSGHQNTVRESLQRNFSVDQETTAILFGAANDAFKTQPVEILQAALLYSFVSTFQDRPAPTIFNEGHGREPWDNVIDPSGTVGCMYSPYP
jgi:hypothetical protein